MNRAQYCNLEVMIHAFKQNIIDLSEAEIVSINTAAAG